MRFEFATAGRVLVGAGRAAELPGVLSGLGSRVLVCTGKDPARHAGLVDGLGMPTAVLSTAGSTGYSGRGTATTWHPAATAERSPFVESSTAAHRSAG